jgi:hypothetical protein
VEKRVFCLAQLRGCLVEILVLVNEVCAASPSNAIIGFYEARHFGKTYNLNSPEIVSGAKAASIWSKVLGKEIRYAGADMDAFEAQMRKTAPSWSAFDIRMMFEGYLERGFIAEDGDLETLTKLLGHAPRRYEDFGRETFLKWQEMPKAA